MNFLQRLLKIGQAEAHSTIDKMEDPIKMSEQAIRDMKADLDKALEALAQVKAMAIRAKNEVEEYTSKASDYTQKAMLLLKKGHAQPATEGLPASENVLSAGEADRLAKEALIKKEEANGQVKRAHLEKEKFELNVQQMEGNVATIKQNISKWENELKTLRARVKVADATKNLNKQMAQIDSHGTVSLLERMKDKVIQEEALAEAYGDMANKSKSIDAEIDKAIQLTESKAEDELAQMKEQLGITTP